MEVKISRFVIRVIEWLEFGQTTGSNCCASGQTHEIMTSNRHCLDVLQQSRNKFDLELAEINNDSSRVLECHCSHGWEGKSEQEFSGGLQISFESYYGDEPKLS